MDGKVESGRPEPGAAPGDATFGWWPSPWPASVVAAAKVSRGGLQGDRGSFYWCESRPDLAGRQVVVRARPGRDRTDVSPEGVSVRSQVHEYGGGAVTVADGVVFYVDQADQRWYRTDPTAETDPVPLTPYPPSDGPSIRHADGRITRSGRWLVSIEERVSAEATDHRLVAVAVDGSLTVVPVVEEGQFLIAPRPSPDGQWLAWVTWEHPFMPWDRSEVWLARMAESAQGVHLGHPVRVAGGGDISVGQPLWCRDGSLVFIDDRSGWWNPYRLDRAHLGDGARSVPLAPRRSEFHAPDWVVGQATLAELSDGTLVTRMREAGRDQVVRLRRAPGSAGGTRTGGDAAATMPWSLEVVAQPCVSIAGLAVGTGAGMTPDAGDVPMEADRVCVVGSTVSEAQVVFEIALDGSVPPRRLSAEPQGAEPSPTSGSRPFTATTPAGPVPGVFFAPIGPDASVGPDASDAPGPGGARPPLVIVLTPARTVPQAAPDAPAEPSEPAARRWVLVLGLVAILAAVVFPFAPVVQPQVDYRWSAGEGAAALPLMPYQPVTLTATLDCAAARAAAPGALLLSTVPPHPDPAAEPLAGLRLTTEGDAVGVTSDGVELGRVPLPAGPCTVTFSSDPRATTVRVDQTVVLAKDGDVRPAVVGAFSDLGDGVTLALTADTRFQTTITPLKAAVALVGVLALLGMLVALHRTDAARGRRVRARRGWWRPRLVDLAVTALLGVWWVIGAVTVDDGYIAGIVRSRGESGFIGNVYRWLNAPESPFSWFYDVLWPWSQISASTLWMRLPATLLGLLTWGLLSRCALPRLGVHKPWLAALAFTTWWVPLCLGLRPEPWVAAGLLGCWVLVERAVATRRLVPLVLGLVVAGATTALTPGGLIAFTPFLAGVRPVLRLLRNRTDLHQWPLFAALVAAPASAVLLMVYDQSLAGMLESTRVRSLIGGGVPWYDEAQRYTVLLTDGFQGSIGRRAAVLITLLAAAAVLMAVRRGPKRRIVVTLLLTLAVMVFTPTKWTQHFGDLAGVGAAVLVLGAATARRTVGAFAATVGVCVFVVAAMNSWPFVSGWFTPTFSTLPPQVAGIPLATLLLVAGAVVVAVVVGGALWHGTAPALPSRLPGPVPLAVVVLVFALALQVLSLARVAIAHRDSYTLAADAVATLRGDPCSLQRTLSVETDPASGLLPHATTGVPVDIGGTTLPGLVVDHRVSTDWSPLRGDLVVVTTVGTLRPSDDVHLQFAGVDAPQKITTPNAAPFDVRVPVPAGATAVRLVVDAAPGGTAKVTLPRAPRLTPMEQVLPRGTRAILDWPVAFLFPCLVPEPLPLGTAGLATWRVAPPTSDPAAGITYAPGFGGPFAGPRLLVTQQRLPTYLAGDPTRDVIRLYRWIPIAALSAPQPVVTEHTVMGWASDGHARVPGLDPVG